MQWLEYSIETTHEAAEVITDFLSSLGADGVQVEDAEEIKEILSAPDSLTYADDDFMDNLDPVVHIKAYFARFEQGVRRNLEISLTADALYDDAPKTYVSEADLETTIREKLVSVKEFLDIGSGYMGYREIEEDDWSDGWKKYYETLHLTKRLVINPSWIEYEAAAGEIVIELDPGSAFGTGTHETTALCASILDRVLKPQNSILDLGTGSGILAIIAAKLGCQDVEAIDIDQMAVEVAAANAAINQTDIQYHAGELKDAYKTKYDIIVANIIADIIISLSSDFPQYMHDNSILIVSGIIEDKAAAVREKLSQAGLKLVEEQDSNDWHAMVWQKQ
ncbi:MAG: 50S ribosomal protein L11 methyltransferase [Clostridiaceae bacterium]|nr:50S ribosomal protein L11 methyltransferase [Clostridiaceae bacterium]